MVGSPRVSQAYWTKNPGERLEIKSYYIIMRNLNTKAFTTFSQDGNSRQDNKHDASKAQREAKN